MLTPRRSEDQGLSMSVWEDFLKKFTSAGNIIQAKEMHNPSLAVHAYRISRIDPISGTTKIVIENWNNKSDKFTIFLSEEITKLNEKLIAISSVGENFRITPINSEEKHCECFSLKDSFLVYFGSEYLKFANCTVHT